MKLFAVMMCVLVSAPITFASHVTKSYICSVVSLINSVHEKRTNDIDRLYLFDEEKHDDLTPLSKEEQLQLLKDIPIENITVRDIRYTFRRIDVQKDLYLLKVREPFRLDFVIGTIFEPTELQGPNGTKIITSMDPAWRYVILAVRETAQQPPAGDSQKLAPEE